MTHDVQWYSPAPIWPRRLGNGTRDRLRRPELLTFESDDFMGELQTTLRDASARFHARLPDQSGHADSSGSGGTDRREPLSLYHPANERYYLVTASLVCRERGLPDRAVDRTNDERVSFVLRRLVSDESAEDEGVQEYGWFGEEHGWHAVNSYDSPLTLAVEDGGTSRTIQEERISMFPQNYRPTTAWEQMEGKRRLWAGLIPVAKRDTFETAPIHRSTSNSGQPNGGQEVSWGSGSNFTDPRKPEFQARIVDPFKRMWDSLRAGGGRTPREVRDPLLFAWLDFWQFLERYLSDVAETIAREEEAAVNPFDFAENGRQKVALLDTLTRVSVSHMGLGDHPTDVLRTVADKTGSIEGGRLDEVLDPDFLQDTARDDLRDDVQDMLWGNASGSVDFDDTTQLARKVYAGLPEVDRDNLSSDVRSLVDKATAGPASDGGTYVVRCVYERPNCPPSRELQVSEPTRAFRLASFFDAGAPARDINITMPGITMEKLRGSPKSVTMHFTEELSRQAGRIQEEATKGLDADAGKPIDLGMLCSLSIPIITICALILLLVIVVVLNIVFWWLPFFKICLPFPGSSSGST